jgi:signal transduction histidine kinase/CheY-like chemotaxis protein
MPLTAALPSKLDQRLKRLVVWISMAGFASLVLVSVLDLRDRRRLLLDEGQRRASNLALMLAEHLREAFAATDVTLRQLAIYSRQIDGPAAPSEQWQRMLEVSRTRRNALGSISVIDAAGVIRHSTVPAIVGNTRRENFIFRRLASADRDLLVADTPTRSTSDPELMLIPVGRRLTDEQGKFAGAVVATFTPSHLRDFFTQVDVGPGGRIWVFHPQGDTIFQIPAARAGSESDAAGKLVFEHTRTMQAAKEVRLPAQPGIPASLLALHSSGEPRLLIAVSLPESALLEDWRRDVHIVLGLLAIAGGGIALMVRALFRQIEARTEAEHRLVRAQRLDAVGQLTGGVAHDFNNLLTVIMMNVSVLKLPGSAGANDSRDATHIRQIEAAAKRAAALIQQLLTFARKQPLHAKRADLNSLARDLEPMLARLLGEDIHLVFSFAAMPCFAEVDPVQLETALMNLCLNARDAMPTGGRLEISSGFAKLTREDIEKGDDAAPGRYVYLGVADTGAGIAPENLPRIFEPFFTTKAVGKGTGLGLSMVYGFVKQSGGFVKVQSQVGRGTEVRIHFPQVEAPKPREPVRAAAETRSGGETILLLEDESVVREVAELMLRKLGYNVVSARDGAEALARAREMSRLDLFLTDVVLPGGMNGRQVAEQLERERPGLRVLYASGYSLDVLHERNQLEPGLRLLTKPYDLQQLSEAIRATLGEPAPKP